MNNEPKDRVEPELPRPNSESADSITNSAPAEVGPIMDKRTQRRERRDLKQKFGDLDSYYGLTP